MDDLYALKRRYWFWLHLTELLSLLIFIQRIRAMPIYSQNACVFCYLYITDILRYTPGGGGGGGHLGIFGVGMCRPELQIGTPF